MLQGAVDLIPEVRRQGAADAAALERRLEAAVCKRRQRLVRAADQQAAQEHLMEGIGLGVWRYQQAQRRRTPECQHMTTASAASDHVCGSASATASLRTSPRPFAGILSTMNSVIG